VERLTKKELRALLECIKECYRICDLATFARRVISRLSKIVPTEMISHNGVNGGRNAHATYPHDAPIKGIAPNHKKLLPNPVRAYRNAKTVTRIQQKVGLVEGALDTLHLGLIVLTPDGKVSLATEWAVQQVRNYLACRALRGSCLPEPLRRWVRQHEVSLKGKDNGHASCSPLIVEREGKRLVIQLVSDLDQSLLLLEEHPTTMRPHSLPPCGLSAREAQVLDWLSQGKTNKEIGVTLKLSPRTVQKHLEHIYEKIGVKNRTAAAARAYEIASIANKQ
jgi:DNA-binding CsgD family transcriptional regulator